MARTGWRPLSAVVAAAGRLVLGSLAFDDLVISASHLVMDPRGSPPLLLVLSGSLALPTPLRSILAVNKWRDFLLVLLLPVIVVIVL